MTTALRAAFRLGSALLCLLPVVAFAADGGPVKIDAAKLQAPLVDLAGRALLDPGPTPDDPKCEKCLPLTIGIAAGACLSKEQGKGPAYWALAQRISGTKTGTIDLTVAEIHAVRECVDKGAPAIAGQVDPAIDPTYTPPEIK